MADAPGLSSLEQAVGLLLLWAYSEGSRAADRDLGRPLAECSLPRMRPVTSSSIRRRLERGVVARIRLASFGHWRSGSPDRADRCAGPKLPPAPTGARPDWMEPLAQTINAAKKYVVSSTVQQVDWNAELVRGDLATPYRNSSGSPARDFRGGCEAPIGVDGAGIDR